jgi:hypothetical protein
VKKPKWKLPLKRKSKDELLNQAKGYIRGETPSETADSAPVRVTNESIAQHREEVLKGARRFIYPLKASKHKIAIVSSIIIGLVLAALLATSWWLLYKRQNHGDFTYRITQILPWPVAKVGGEFIRYEEYLFELRHNVHYLTTQENVDFTTEEGQLQLAGLKQQAYKNTIDNAIIRQMAGERGVSVSQDEVTQQIDLIRSSGGIGDSSQTLEDTLHDFYDWDLNDLRRVIRSQLLKQKLLPLLDTEVRPEAEEALADIMDGADFAAIAKAQSDDVFTKDNGGEFGFIFRSNTEIPPQLVERAFSLEAGQTGSELVETLFGLHIVKTLEYRSEQEAKVAHILFRYRDIDDFVTEKKAELTVSDYIDIAG